MKTIAIVGRPNVGKSSLFNRLIGHRQAIISDTPGTTRDTNIKSAYWNGRHFQLLDTAGLMKAKTILEENIQSMIAESAKLADIIVITVDAGTILTDEDLKIIKFSHKTGKPLILAINKIDSVKTLAEDFRRTGISTIIPISALSGRGTGDLLDEIVKLLPETTKPEIRPDLSIAIMGRPNVGKSSLINALSGQTRAVTDDTAGTTRDAISVRIAHDEMELEVTDTAGLRRRGQIKPGIERYGSMRAAAAAKVADVCIIVMDASDAPLAGDTKIAGLAKDSGAGIILALNKIDLVDAETLARVTRKITAQFQFCWWAPLVLVSAMTRKNVAELLHQAELVKTNRSQKIATPALNRTLAKLTAQQPPAGRGRYQPKLKYCAQLGSNPPKITLFGTHTDKIHFSYVRFLENGLRKDFELTGTPVILNFTNNERKT